ncbi:esterase-like protein [Strigomonas culicis]|uniref:Esterase-like protein n=1 Tax=Strigomonas culicis TaxID=28005 RepID=S9TRI5_9TRYP|nr:esterase-like protein [Strigomonas culicis]|eukprot:EPY21002.1 esterase-like protein [Strigomonas culicis]
MLQHIRPRAPAARGRRAAQRVPAHHGTQLSGLLLGRAPVRVHGLEGQRRHPLRQPRCRPVHAHGRRRGGGAGAERRAAAAPAQPRAHCGASSAESDGSGRQRGAAAGLPAGHARIHAARPRARRLRAPPPARLSGRRRGGPRGAAGEHRGLQHGRHDRPALRARLRAARQQPLPARHLRRPGLPSRAAPAHGGGRADRQAAAAAVRRGAVQGGGRGLQGALLPGAVRRAALLRGRVPSLDARCGGALRVRGRPGAAAARHRGGPRPHAAAAPRFQPRRRRARRRAQPLPRARATRRRGCAADAVLRGPSCLLLLPPGEADHPPAHGALLSPLHFCHHRRQHPAERRGGQRPRLPSRS